MRIVGKPWGSEFIWAETFEYVGKFLNFKPGCETSKHYHTEKDETVILIEGDGFIELPEGLFPMVQAVSWRIVNGTPHRFMAGPKGMKLVEVSTPETGTTVRVQDLYGRGNEVYT